jgi:prepilin-type N-terminal cleavage/methylation domain-containing protein/prepilin-type processing-associated H-X9-DG protein
MKKKRGFTLIELLVVIAIIALLMSILMPALSKVRKQAMTIVCQARLKQWGVIFSMYTGENGSYMHQRQIGNLAGYLRTWPYTYKKMYLEPKMRFCPTADNAARTTGCFGTWHYEGNQFRPDYQEPAMRMPGESEFNPETGNIEAGWFTGSFGMNRLVENMQGGNEGTAGGYWRRTDVKGADRVPVLGDCQYLYYNGSTGSPPIYNGTFTGNQMAWICIDRHMGYVNFTYLDFSVRKTGLKELWTLKHDRLYDTCNEWTICNYGGDRASCHSAWHGTASWTDRYPEY